MFQKIWIHTHTHNHFTALWNLSGKTRVSRYQKKHSPTTLIVVINHPYLLSPSTMIHGILYSIYVLYSLSTISRQVFWHPTFHTPYISSRNHYLLFATHTHTMATCFAVVPRLCHLNLVSLSTLLGTLSCNFTPHIHLTIHLQTINFHCDIFGHRLC